MYTNSVYLLNPAWFGQDSEAFSQGHEGGFQLSVGSNLCLVWLIGLLLEPLLTKGHADSPLQNVLYFLTVGTPRD